MPVRPLSRDRMKARSAILPPLPRALHLVPGAEGHPLLESDPLPLEESSSSSRNIKRESSSAGEQGRTSRRDAGLLAMKFVGRMRGGKRLLHRRHALDDAETMRNAAREATRRWFCGLVDTTLQERADGASAAERERAKASMARAGSLEIADEFFFLAGLDDAAREQWASLCSMGVVSPWDPVTRQQRYVLKAKKAGEHNLQEQEARIRREHHEQHLAELAHAHEHDHHSHDGHGADHGDEPGHGHGHGHGHNHGHGHGHGHGCTPKTGTPPNKRAAATTKAPTLPAKMPTPFAARRASGHCAAPNK